VSYGWQATRRRFKCPHCRKWHPLIQKHTTGTDATIRMLLATGTHPGLADLWHSWVEGS